MIHVEEQELDIAFPSTEMSFVLMQPYVYFSQPLREPYRWSDIEVEAQHAAIRRTLHLAINNGNIPHFVVFPEYSIPGIAGVDIIDEMVRSGQWPCHTVVIAGIDGLCCDDYRALTQKDGTYVHVSNGPDQVPPDHWVNCCVTWTKEADGNVRVWVQPKIRPASPELRTSASDMFCGSAVNIFKARYDKNNYPCRFFSLICFDWMARLDGTLLPNAVLDELNRAWLGSPAPLHWVFVLQQNTRPNHPDFLGSTRAFLTDITSYTSVERDHAVVIMAANAASAEPSRCRNGACSSFVYSPTALFLSDACKPTFCMAPQTLRKSDVLSNCKDIVFREMGACINICRVRVPRFVTPTTTDRVIPITSAHVYGLQDEIPFEPRLPGSSVPAAVKWINDEIDLVDSVADSDLPGAPLEVPVQNSHDTASGDIRTLAAREIERRIQLALSVPEDEWQAYLKSPSCNVDEWDVGERDALRHMMCTIAILGACHKVDVQKGRFHAQVDAPSAILQLVAIIGKTHQECREHFDRAAKPGGVDPVILITRNPSNTRFADREMAKITDPAGNPGLCVRSYSDVIQACIDSDSVTKLREELNDIFRPDEKRII